MNAGLDPNHNLIFEEVIEISDVEALGTLKWDLFRVESLLRKAVADEERLQGTLVAAELERALESFDEDSDVARYRERFVRDADRLNHDELVTFIQLALRVREQLHTAYVRYLRYTDERLRTQLEAIDTDDIVRGTETIEGGTIQETHPRRTLAFIVHTKKSTREIFAEVEFVDWGRIIEWHEQMIPRLAALLSEARLVYTQKRLSEQAVAMTQEVRTLSRVAAAATGLAALATIVVAILFVASLG